MAVNSFAFGGTADWVSAGNQLNPGTTSFTIMAWVYGSVTANFTGYIAGKDGVTNRDWLLDLTSTAGSLYNVALFVPTTASAGTYLLIQTADGDFPNATWAHIAAVCNFSTGAGTIFVDNVQKGTATNALVTTSSNTTNSFKAGNTDRNNQVLQGRIAEVKYFARALGTSEIANERQYTGVRAANCLMYWPFNDASVPGTVIDQSDGINGTTNGAIGTALGPNITPPPSTGINTYRLLLGVGI